MMHESAHSVEIFKKETTFSTTYTSLDAKLFQDALTTKELIALSQIICIHQMPKSERGLVSINGNNGWLSMEKSIALFQQQILFCIFCIFI